MKNRRKILQWVKHVRRQETLVSVFFVTLFIGLAALLTLIPPQAAPFEITSAESAQSIKDIIQNPLNAPYKITAFGLTQLSPSVRAVRFVSLVFLGATLVAMYYTLRHWHSIHASALTTLAFGLNATVLAVGRLGTPLISLMSWFVITALLLWLLHTRSNKLIPIVSLVVIGITLYVPGAIWFYFTGSIVMRKRLKKLFKHVKRQAILLGLLALLLLVEKQ